MTCDKSPGPGESVQGPRSSETETPVPFDRRTFLRTCGAAAPVLLGVFKAPSDLLAQETETDEVIYAMGVDVQQCIGCARCVVACKTENDVPAEETFFNTWIEQYTILANDEVIVESPNGGIDGWPDLPSDSEILKTFFVPKLCNHCENAPCVQVCPVGATFTSPEGVVLVDEDYCIGCRYCVQACPYGARWIHPEKHVAGKCTFCYHRLKEGLLPACVEVCPTGARLFGEVGNRANPLERFRRFNDIQVLKGHLNTKPKVYYAHLDGEVR